MGEIRMTIAVATVLRTFLDDISEPRYGYELMRLTGFPSGKLYPILARLERAGWLIKEREDIDPAAAGRPARRLYRLSPESIQTARHELAALSEQLRLPGGPTVRRMLVGSRLRRLRVEAGIAREQAGAAIRASEWKVHRLENGQVGFKERDVVDLLTLYGVGDPGEVAAVVGMALEANDTGWWHQYGDVLPQW